MAGCCTALSMMPQLFSIWRNKSGHGVSPAMFLVFGLGVVLWIIYGVRINSTPVIAANGATLAEIAGILMLKAKYEGRGEGSDV